MMTAFMGCAVMSAGRRAGLYVGADDRVVIAYKGILLLLGIIVKGVEWISVQCYFRDALYMA